MATATQDLVTLSNGTVEVSVSTLFGPRVMRYAFMGEGNAFAEAPGAEVRTAAGIWRAHGGHRLWPAPEGPECFEPDDEAPQIEGDGRTVLVARGAPSRLGLAREIALRLDPTGARVVVEHRLSNGGGAALRAACWAVTIVAPGRAFVPQEPYRTWEEDYRAARPLVLWHYTDLRDPRFSFTRRTIALSADASRREPQKFGARVTAGWAAAHDGRRTLFVKRFAHDAGAEYPDHGCNVEAYTAGDFLELESLGPLAEIPPGGTLAHRETWELHRVPDDEDAVLAAAAN